VVISLDGIGELHDVQRPFVDGKPSFRFVERTIAELIEQEHRPHISITITQRNASGVADVVRYALDRDLTFSLNFFRDNDCAAGFTDLQFEEQAMISSLLDAFAVIARATAARLRCRPELRGDRPARPCRQVPHGD
jgi:uncharacterized protein